MAKKYSDSRIRLSKEGWASLRQIQRERGFESSREAIEFAVRFAAEGLQEDPFFVDWEGFERHVDRRMLAKIRSAIAMAIAPTGIDRNYTLGD